MKKSEALLFAALAAAPACARQGAETETPATPSQAKPACDVRDPKNREIISQEPGKTVYRVCDDIFVMQTLRAVATTTLRGQTSTQIRAVQGANEANAESVDKSIDAAESVLDVIGVEESPSNPDASETHQD